MDMDDKPHHVVRLAKGGMACMSCGGEVAEDGMAFGGEVVDSPKKSEMSADEKKALFTKAMKSRKTK